MLFEWDEKKAKTNQRKHGISFDEAQTVFTDDLSVMKPDLEHSGDEERLIIMGMSHKKRLLVVVYTERDHAIRLISTRKATYAEQKTYEEEDVV